MVGGFLKVFQNELVNEFKISFLVNRHKLGSVFKSEQVVECGCFVHVYYPTFVDELNGKYFKFGVFFKVFSKIFFGCVEFFRDLKLDNLFWVWFSNDCTHIIPVLCFWIVFLFVDELGLEKF